MLGLAGFGIRSAGARVARLPPRRGGRGAPMNRELGLDPSK